MDRHRLPGCAGVVLAMALCPHAQGAECPREEALGTSRIIAVDAAATHSDLVRQIAAAGHSIGHHTWSHQNLEVMKPEEAVDEIDKGIAAVEMALNGVSTTIPSTPFFRFPGFLTNRQTLDDLQKRRIVVFDADIIADDWIAMTQEAELKLLTDRLKATGKGIILLHDPEPQTAAMPADFLRYPRDNRYRVVHVVPGIAATAANVRQDEKRE